MHALLSARHVDFFSEQFSVRISNGRYSLGIDDTWISLDSVSFLDMYLLLCNQWYSKMTDILRPSVLHLLQLMVFRYRAKNSQMLRLGFLPRCKNMTYVCWVHAVLPCIAFSASVCNELKYWTHGLRYLTRSPRRNSARPAGDVLIYACLNQKHWDSHCRSDLLCFDRDALGPCAICQEPFLLLDQRRVQLPCT